MSVFVVTRKAFQVVVAVKRIDKSEWQRAELTGCRTLLFFVGSSVIKDTDALSLRMTKMKTTDSIFTELGESIQDLNYVPMLLCL